MSLIFLLGPGNFRNGEGGMLFFCRRVKMQAIPKMPLNLGLIAGPAFTCTHILLANSSQMNGLKDERQRNTSDLSAFVTRVWMWRRVKNWG